MSLLSPFNFTFFPTTTFPNGLDTTNQFGSTGRFDLNQQQQPAQALPESIASNYQGQGQSYTDYYGNPGNIQDVPNSNYQSYQNIPQAQQPQRKRRPKNRRAPQPPGLTYGTEQIQQQSYDNFRYPQTLHPQVNLSPNLVRVTPIQGPIYAKNGHLPVVPLYAYNAVKNGTLLQIPILWTALSYALGLELRGEILRGLPCIKRLNQLFCPTAGNTYPLENIERFIDENKALIKRMYGEFVMNADIFGGPSSGGGNALRRSAREVYESEVSEFFGKSKNSKLADLAENLKTDGNEKPGNGTHSRKKRQTVNPINGAPTQQPKSNRVDSCESTVEITTPYWAANSAGKVRAIVNTQHFEQAIQQEVCTNTATKRCVGDCGCEQKYKWHRLLAYDPDNDCKGIFMDWFLFPSCCVCRCDP